MPLRTVKIKLAAVFLACAAFFSCGGTEGRIELPATPLLGSGSRWVVVDSAYLVLKEEPSSRAADAATARRSEILEMTSRVRAKDAKGTERLWYGLAKCGKTLWAEAEGLALYDSLEKARTAAGALR